MKVRIALFATALMFAGSAFAFHCPQDMKKIDDALAKNPKLTEAQMAQVKKDRADGEALHKAGKHQEALDTLAKAEKTLGISKLDRRIRTKRRRGRTAPAFFKGQIRVFTQRQISREPIPKSRV